MGGKYGNKRAIAQEREREVIEMYQRVHCTRVVSEAYGVSDETIRRILKRNGIPRRKPKKEKHGERFPPKNINREQVCDMYRSGVSIFDIAKAMSCSQSAIYYHLEKAGLYKVGKRKAKNDALMPRIIELHKQGLSDYKIADQLGVSHYVVNKRLRKMGIHRGKGTSATRKAVCIRCGKTFVTTTHNQEFCSDTCCSAIRAQRRNDTIRAQANGEVENISLREVYERDKGRCYICGRKTDWNDYYFVNGWRANGPRYPTREHVVAIHNGGTHTRDNVRLACFECNTKKGDKGQMRLAIAV